MAETKTKKKALKDPRLEGKLRKRTPKPGPLGTCDRCKKKRPLDACSPFDQEVEFYCGECALELWKAAMKAGDKVRAERAKIAEAERVRLEAEAEAQRKLIGDTVNRQRQAVAKQRRAISLSAEGNIPLTKRLIGEGKTFDQIHDTFKSIYATQGKTDEKWIASRVRTYYKIAKGE